MDPTTKGNVLMFCGALLVLAAVWLLILGVAEHDPLRLALAVAAGVAAVAVFRVYAASVRRK